MKIELSFQGQIEYTIEIPNNTKKIVFDITSEDNFDMSAISSPAIKEIEFYE